VLRAHEWTWEDATHVDELREVVPDVVVNAYTEPWVNWLRAEARGAFDEIHMYEFLEHTGHQGDYPEWFLFWEQVWHALKPGGMVFATAPYGLSRGAMGDPGHTRFLVEDSFWFLDPCQYKFNEMKRTTMTQYLIGFHLCNKVVLAAPTKKDGPVEHLFVVLEAKK